MLAALPRTGVTVFAGLHLQVLRQNIQVESRGKKEPPDVDKPCKLQLAAHLISGFSL